MSAAISAPDPVTELPPPILIADHPALDLVNSRASPAGTPVEWLNTPQALLNWISALGLTPSAPGQASTPIVPSASALRRVLRLREWLRNLVERQAGASLKNVGAADLALLNAELAQSDSYLQVLANKESIDRSPPLFRKADEAVVQPIANAVVMLLCDADFARIRQCEGAECTLWFLDKTKAGTRRWCSMAVCGNREKARAYRAKR